MSDTHDERGGDESAALTVAQYADRYMAYGDGRSDMDPGRPPIEAMWRVRKQLRDLRKQLAAATARAEKAERERDAWRSEAERRSAERNAAVRRIGLVRECLNVPGELLPGLAELLENGTGRALSATETDADGSQGSADDRTPVRAAAGLSERCRVTKLDEGVRHHCDSDAPHDTHECGDCAHRWDDTTEDGQHG